MFIQAITINLKSPVHRVSSELSISTWKVRFYILLNSIEYSGHLLCWEVANACTRMCCINGVRALGILPVIVYNSAQRIPILLRGITWDTVKLPATEEVTNVLSGLSLATNHVSRQYLLTHSVSKFRYSLRSLQEIIILYMAPRFWKRILEMADKSGCETRQNMLFHRVLYQKFFKHC